MAKGKAASPRRRKPAARQAKAAKAGRKASARKTASRKKTAARKATASAKRNAAPAKRKSAPKRKVTAKARKAATRKTLPKKAVRTAKAIKKPAATAAAPARRRTVSRVVKRAAPVIRKVARPAAPVARKAPALSRVRRTIQDDEPSGSPPSTLDLDRTASAARSGRQALKERFDQHTETSPALTAGDVDADWESAYSVGDEAPGGDSPTPDQDIVDDIGRAVGVEYQDNEELKGEEKIAQRDRHRWELDPASSEDYDDR
jgi:hypothetical protein